MASWSEIEATDPGLAGRVDEAFGARRLKCLATLRPSGWPRLSETSGVWLLAGELWLALIPSRKEQDLRSDDRVSVHCGSPTDTWSISARVSGHAVAADGDDLARFLAARDRDDLPGVALYRVEVTEVVATGPHPDTGEILIGWWNEQGGSATASRAGG